MKLNENYMGSGTCDWIFTVVKPGFLDKAQDVIKTFEERGWEVLKTCPKNYL